MSNYNQCLLKVPMFQSLPEADLLAITKLIEPRSYEAMETIIQENDAITRLGVIHKGSVKVCTYNEAGKEHILAVLLPGDYFGEHALIKDENAQYEIVALEKTWICTLDIAQLRLLMRDKQTMTFSMMQSLIDRIAQTQMQSTQQSLMNAEKRLFHSLLHYAQEDGNVMLPLSKKDLARSLDMSPETFSRRLKDLEKKGKLIRGAKGKIKILNLDNSTHQA